MNLYQTIRSLQTIAASNPYINSVGDGSIYQYMDANPSIKYGVFFVTQTTHRENEYFDYFSFNLFVIDRLIDDLESNRLQIQSIAKDVLSNTIQTFCTKFLGVTHNEIRYVPFTQRFSDLCAGQYCTVELRIPKSIICEEDFEDLVVFTGDCKTCYDEGYADGLSQTYEDGFESGRTYQKSLLVATQFTENGTYATENGYCQVVVNVDVEKYFTDGFESGVTYQKNQLEPITITENGTYSTENGYGQVVVDVECISGDCSEAYESGWTNGYVSGNTDGYEEGYADGLADCSGSTYEEGYSDGFEDGYQSGYTDGINACDDRYEEGYESGKTDGYESGYTGGYDSGKTDGIDYQKSLLEGIYITDNGQYNKVNGYSSVTVNINTQAYYDSGYSKGYDDGLAACSGTTPYLDTDTDSIKTKSDGETVNINVYSNTDWVVDSDEWITVSPISGSGNGSIVVNIDSATSGRTGSIILSGDGVTKTIDIEQVTIDYENEYLTIEVTDIVDEGSIILRNTGSTTLPVSIKINDGQWQELTDFNYTYDNPSVGDIIKIKGTNGFYNGATIGTSNNYVFYNVYGNIMSLIYGDNFQNQTTIESAQTFQNLFHNSTTLSDVSNLVLPATTLANSCYCNMFKGCTNLTSAPELPATTLGSNCYDNMFNGCINLINAPELPATTLTGWCYFGMFLGCASLTQAPELPATTLNSYCYNRMFSGCTSLTTAPALPATTLTDNCYYYMFEGCTSLTTAPELPATTLASSCYDSMFRNCKSLTSAPVLPATILVSGCYSNMFYGCSQLNYIKCLAENPATGYTRNWGKNVAPTGTFVKASGVTDWIIDNVNSIPIGWTVVDDSGSTDYSTEYLSFEIISGGTFAVTKGFEEKELQYRLNNGNWTNVGYNASFTVNIGDIVQFRGTNFNMNAASRHIDFHSADTNLRYNVYGNIMSLINPTDFSGITSLSSCTFENVFSNNNNVVNANNLVIPLVTATSSLGRMMFADCTNLVSAPSLPATILASHCYSHMFEGCTSLTQAPELPATTLTEYCYYSMFLGCTSLNYIKCLATDISANNCTVDWTGNVAASGTFVKAAGMNDWPTGQSGYNGIPNGWTVQDA